jgi:hypothetical protein
MEANKEKKRRESGGDWRTRGRSLESEKREKPI